MERFEAYNSTDSIPITQVERSGEKDGSEKESKVLPVPVESAQGKRTYGWMDRLTEAIVGDDSRYSKYALICDRCFMHNGLVLPEELGTKKYICPNCGFFHNEHLTPKPQLVSSDIPPLDNPPNSVDQPADETGLARKEVGNGSNAREKGKPVSKRSSARNKA